MTYFTGNQTGRVHLIHLTNGDDLLKSIKKACAELGIKTGIVTSGIGSMRKVVYHYTDAKTEKPKDIHITIDNISELVSLDGIILEGDPHLHGLFTEGGGEICHGAHIEEGCEVMYLAEISIIEVDNLPVGRRSGEYGTITHFVKI